MCQFEHKKWQIKSRSIFVCVLDFLVIDNTKSLLKSHLVNYLKKYITTIAIAAITDTVKNVKSVGLVFVFALRLWYCYLINKR
jgi:uncharacterized membrane protein